MYKLGVNRGVNGSVRTPWYARLDSKSEDVGVLILDVKPGHSTEELLKTLAEQGLIYPEIKFLKNIVILYHTDNVCKQLANELK